MLLSSTTIFFSVLILLGIMIAIVIYRRKNKSRALSIQFVQINKAAEYLILGEKEHLFFSDIQNLRPASQFYTSWNEYGLDHQKYDLVYFKDGMKQIVSLIVYDNEPESVAKRDELKAIVAGLRYARIQKIKKNL